MKVPKLRVLCKGSISNYTCIWFTASMTSYRLLLHGLSFNVIVISSTGEGLDVLLQVIFDSKIVPQLALCKRKDCDIRSLAISMSKVAHMRYVNISQAGAILDSLDMIEKKHPAPCVQCLTNCLVTCVICALHQYLEGAIIDHYDLASVKAFSIMYRLKELG